MKLERLVLENFRRHRRTAIEWPDGVTAIVGPNGAGKSTLLEALAFALYGPAAARTSKDLLRHSDAGTAAVRVEAELDVGGHAVRVVRELRGKNLTPHAELTIDGTVQVPGGGGSSDAATQAISALLGMGHKAFITTVVARQKELSRLADETPADRKRLLLEMLGVDQVDRAIATARTKRNDAQKQVEAIRSVLADEAGLLAAVTEARKRVAGARVDVAEREAAWAKAKDDLARATAEHETWAEAARQRADAARRVAAAEQALQVAQAQQQALSVRVKEARAAHEKAQELGDTKAALLQAQDALATARRAHDEAAARARAEQRLARERAVITKLEADLAALAPLDAPDVTALRKADEEAQQALTHATTQLTLATSAAREAAARASRLRRLGAEAPCPTCERPLRDHLPTILSQATSDCGARDDAVARAQADATAAKARAEAARAALRQAEAQSEAARRREAERSRVEGRLADARARVQEDLPPAVEAPPLPPLQEAVALAEARHDEAVRCRAVSERLPALQADADTATATLVSVRREADEARAALAARPDPGAAAERAKQAWEHATVAERQMERALLDARHAVAAAQQRLDEAERRRQEEDARRAKVKALEQEMLYWTALAGPRGGGLLDRFRDHLVHRIGPAVSAEAGRLLARFTGGRYTEVLLDDEHRVFVTDGGVPYTLDRFSGGEADLVHLALRLAVSRLLADRAGGAEIRFLALDEVFGGLDAQRRGHVVAALQELGGLYSQVLLITHLDALHDALDSVIEVSEADGASVVT